MSAIIAPLAARASIQKASAALNDFRKMRVTENFTWGEVFANRGLAEIRSATQTVFDNALNQARLMERVRAYLRAQLDPAAVVVVTSWWRSPMANAKAGGATRSRHLLGLATDFNVPGYSDIKGNRQVQAELIELRKIIPFALEITGGGWTHVDIRPSPVVFDKANKVYTQREIDEFAKAYRGS